MIPPPASCSSLYDVLQRARRLQPGNGITFLDNAHEKAPKRITYDELLREAKVGFLVAICQGLSDETS